jgi:CheY-like chemotaxis protein
VAQILIVDDDPDVREMIRLLLEAHGHVVTNAASGDAAYAVTPAIRPDVVVTDMQMPRMDGFQLSQAIRARPGLEQLPIVVLSALGEDDEGWTHCEPGRRWRACRRRRSRDSPRRSSHSSRPAA